MPLLMVTLVPPRLRNSAEAAGAEWLPRGDRKSSAHNSLFPSNRLLGDHPLVCLLQSLAAELCFRNGSVANLVAEPQNFSNAFAPSRSLQPPGSTAAALEGHWNTIS